MYLKSIWSTACSCDKNLWDEARLLEVEVMTKKSGRDGTELTITNYRGKKIFPLSEVRVEIGAEQRQLRASNFLRL